MATAIIIWLIGYLYTLGIERRLCDEREEPMELEDAIKLIVTWPCYLGYLGVFQKAPDEIEIAEPEVQIDDDLLER